MEAGIRIGFEHDLFLYGKTPVGLPPGIEAWADAPRIVACPGSTWCGRGIADSRQAGGRIAAALPKDTGLSICINGCPNNCGHAPVADIGLIGRIKSVGGVRTECFRLLAGGGKGRSPRLAEELHPAVPAAKADAVVAALVADYNRQRSGGESFEQFVSREKARLMRAVEAQVGTASASS